ncbi:hypothetical protein JR316_0001530 [Psilocybe cubensis]|nr:hypothetical protein JR316_0001530 [Psilocybe cubensis]KAH9487454.1 hypothetical protein JR316_0001530 [Psilocybe cubensis]
MLFSRITHVCSLWRSVALANGFLWSRITLVHPVHPRSLSYVATWLTRSNPYPIDLIFDLRDPEWDWNEDNHVIRWQEMETIVRLILPHVKRWRLVELLTDTWAPIFTFLWYTRAVESAPMLETLSLTRCNAYYAARGQTFEPSSLAEPMKLFGGIAFESLRSVTLVGVHIDWNQPTPRNLRKLELKFQASSVMPSLSQFNAIVNNCPHLSHLVIYGWGPTLPDSSPPSIETRVRIQNLQTLSLGLLDADYTTQFLSFLDVPLLKHLILEDVTRAVSPSETPDATSLFRWLSRSISSHSDRKHYIPTYLPLPSLKSLELRGISIGREELVPVFRQLSSLTHLGLYNVSDETITALGDPCENNSQHSLPNLRELVFQDVNAEVVLDVVTQRASLGAALDRISLRFCSSHPISTNSITYLRLLNAGFDISGSTGSESTDSDDGLYQEGLKDLQWVLPNSVEGRQCPAEAPDVDQKAHFRFALCLFELKRFGEAIKKMDEYREVIGGKPTAAERELRSKILHAIMDRDQGRCFPATERSDAVPGRLLRYEVKVFNNAHGILFFDDIPEALCSKNPPEIPSRLYAVKLVSKYHNAILKQRDWLCWNCQAPAISFIHSPALYFQLKEPKVVDYAQPICEDGGNCDISARNMMAETMRLTATLNQATDSLQK